MIQNKHRLSIRNFFFRGIIPALMFSCNTPSTKVDAGPEKNEAAFVSHTPQSIWPASVPDSDLVTGREMYNDGMAANVSHPTMTIFSPSGKNTGAAIIVFPGGGYMKLAVELEGSEICKWLASVGVTAILLKYRVPASGPHHDDSCNCEKDPLKPLALQDAQRTFPHIFCCFSFGSKINQTYKGLKTL